MVTLAPGVRLRGGVLEFGAKGVRLTRDNVLEDVTVHCPEHEAAILNDTSVTDFGTLTLRGVRTTGQVLLLARDTVRSGHVTAADVVVEAADVPGGGDHRRTAGGKRRQRRAAGARQWRLRRRARRPGRGRGRGHRAGEHAADRGDSHRWRYRRRDTGPDQRRGGRHLGGCGRPGAQHRDAHHVRAERHGAGQLGAGAGMDGDRAADLARPQRDRVRQLRGLGSLDAQAPITTHGTGARGFHVTTGPSHARRSLRSPPRATARWVFRSAGNCRTWKCAGT